MSVYTALSRFIPNGRNNNNNNNNNTHSSSTSLNDATEMTQIIDIDSIIATADARNQIRSLTSLAEDDDDNTSISSDSTEYPRTSTTIAMGKDYYKDEEDDVFYAADEQDESRQRLVQTNDLENGSEDTASIVSLERGKRKGNEKWICALLVGLLVVAGIFWGISIAGVGQDQETIDENMANHIDFNDLYNDSFVPKRQYLEWVKNDPRDGVFTFTDKTTNDILIESVEDGETKILVKTSDLRVNDGILSVSSFEISADFEYIMLWTNVTQQWRHSTRSNIYVYKVADKSVAPLSEESTVESEHPIISYATWSPTGHQVLFVMENDLYVSDLEDTRRITFDGSETVFNGVPDWVYEEEIFSKDFTVWWSPDSTHIAYLRFNETAVPEYRMPLYTASNSSYPEEMSIKYPKAGTPNPLVSLHVHSLLDDTSIMITKNSTTANSTIHAIDNYKDFEDDDRLIIDVLWATEGHDHLLFKQTNRVQDHEITSLVTIGKSLPDSRVELARRYEPTDGGWIDVAQSMVYVPSGGSKTKKKQVQYLDIADDGNGYMHLAIFSVGDGEQHSPVWLTSGEWEVLTESVVMDTQRELLHFISTERSPLERHLYTVHLGGEDPASTKQCLTCPEDPEVHGYYRASFSPKSGYYVLHYEGPDIPTTVVKSVDDNTFELVLENNDALRSLLSDYELPKSRMVTVKSGGIEMNAVEMLPPNFKPKEKYPVLFHVYGGPGSQLVSHQFELDWHHFLASKLRYIVVTVDGRGTGFRGREYRTCVRKRLGELEVIDQVNAAKHWTELEYVDKSRIAIWGWSYGGYMTSKVLESNDGVFAAGMAVAPVTDWRYYDSIYTERYMLTPQLNPEGYEQSAVNNMTGFNNANYLLAHGTGDDNGNSPFFCCQYNV
ncbi:dipeptidyl peptidase IV N-terminal region-domain-containing protein [Phascolomyces articulosus]|uniref:Dipeptidyl peptidase IV N-terminal region-domain-containing protein n=1 Tax=Phascolomyces articulosus TaxID=60185 RepID=A0AAD5PIK6_9FUNG|nr:dipeptidyl peptidase IV N-terminal region-domain-containing protein [Phascolomyces articulosus]